MTSFATQSNIQMTNSGLLGRSTASAGKSTRIAIGTGLTLSAGTLSNSLDLSGYVPYTGATGAVTLGSYGLTCGAITASGLLSLVNSTTPMEFNLHSTYTSSTSREYLKALATTGGAYQIGSAIGSAGGTNRAVEIGHFNSGGTFTSALSVATSGSVTASGSVTVNQLVTNNRYVGFGVSGANGWIEAKSTGSEFRLWNSSINSYADVACAALTCGAITASGAITPATLTDAAAPNGSIYYSSTASKLVYKDGGGVVNNLY